MPISVIQAANNFGQGISSITTAAITTTPGNLLHANLVHFPVFSSFADNKSNAFSSVANAERANNCRGRQLYQENCAGGSGHTFTLTTATTGNLGLCVLEISGLVTSSAKDQAISANSSGTTTQTSTTVTSLQADEIFCGLFADNSAVTMTCDSNFVQQFNQGGFLLAGTRIVSATETRAFVTTTSANTNGSSFIVSYKMAAGPVTITPPAGVLTITGQPAVAIGVSGGRPGMFDPSLVAQGWF